ncbi:MAG: ABC transporter ATP-binding protein/permease [Gammaproteobacteria bacterium]|nr:ABC transporter ATP-binding protein/permease [Gammaproteobacteria bacterium]MCF6231205.1 ABC transporter ATP-binding protein/permease [Gammaproteobacteria bacterium]
MKLPLLFAGRRKQWFVRLVSLSIIEALALFAVAMLFRELLIVLHASGPTSLPGYLSLALVFSAVVIALAHWGANSISERLGMDYSNTLRLVLLRSCVVASGGAQPQRLGTTMARMMGDLSAVREWVSQGLATAMVATATLVASFAGLAAIDTQLALHIGVACLVFMALLIPPVASKLFQLAQELRRLRGKLSSQLGDLVLSASTVAHMGRYRSEAGRVDKQNQALMRASVARTRILSLLTALTVIVVPASVAWVSLLLARGYPLPMQQPGSWTTLLFTLSLLSVSLTGLVRSLDQLINYIVARRRLLQLMKTAKQARLSRRGRRALPRGEPLAIDIRSLSRSGIQVTAPLHAPAGSTVALVGASGTGKSHLLRHFLQASNGMGEVSIAGLKLRKIDLTSLSKRVHLVTPEFALMRGSLLRNLRYAAPIKRRRLRHICRLCQLTGTDARVARKQRLDQTGKDLPSALAARVRLARALASRPGLLLVDDAAFLYDPLAREALRTVQGKCKLTLVIATPDIRCVNYLRPDVVWQMEEGDKGRQITPQKNNLTLLSPKPIKRVLYDR